MTDKKEIDKKNYIKVSYANKNKAKELGARWDASAKSWYYYDNLCKKNVDALKML